MYISYTGDSQFEACNFAYWNSYINGTVLPTPDDRLGSVFGSVVGNLVEDLYNLELWREDQPQGAVMSRVDATIDKILKQETSPTKYRKAGILKWKGKAPNGNPRAMYENREDLTADVRDAVARCFRIIRHERLLGPLAKAEVKLDCDIEGHRIAGRADLIIRRTKPHFDLVLADGKGSRHRETYTDSKQLRWYEMLFREKTGGAPDKLCFVFWRYEPDEAFDWLAPDEEACNQLRDRVLANIRQIETLTSIAPAGVPFREARKVFLPKVQDQADPERAEKACRFCPYATEEICPEGAAFRAAKKWK